MTIAPSPVRVTLTAHELNVYSPALQSDRRFHDKAFAAWQQSGHSAHEMEMLQRYLSQDDTISHQRWDMVYHNHTSTFFHSLLFFMRAARVDLSTLQCAVQHKNLHLVEDSIIRPFSPFLLAVGQAATAGDHHPTLFLEGQEMAVIVLLPVAATDDLERIDQQVDTVRTTWRNGTHQPTAHQILHARSLIEWMV